MYFLVDADHQEDIIIRLKTAQFSVLMSTEILFFYLTDLSHNVTNGVAYGCLRTSLRQLCTYGNVEVFFLGFPYKVSISAESSLQALGPDLLTIVNLESEASCTFARLTRWWTH